MSDRSRVTEPGMDFAECDREPIHIPDAIQPHGMLIVLERGTLSAVQGAGDIEGRLGIEEWVGRSAGLILGDALAARIARTADSMGAGGFVGQLRGPSGERLDVSAHQSGEFVCVELEPAPAAEIPSAVLLGGIEAAAGSFERASGLKPLCDRAAVEFRRLTGYDRVLVYRFSEDGSGEVLGEDRDGALGSFLNHHFPSADVPLQARALYVRNLVRVIPDIGYTPAPLRPARPGAEPLDMSDCALRSVSPVHLQYMRNMRVGASASVSIVKDGALWGLVACHNAIPKLLPYHSRAACRALAGAFARQIKVREEAGLYRERIRARGYEDELVARLGRAPSVEEALVDSRGELRDMMRADGLAILSGGKVVRAGTCPDETAIRALGRWALPQALAEPFATAELGALHPPGLADFSLASGLLATAVSAEENLGLLWFRAEQVETINWAGNPHKAVRLRPGETLSPRASFAAWSESVRGRSRPWSAAELEGAVRIRHALLEARQGRRLRELNQQLAQMLADKDLLLERTEVLLKEVNHRVQNSLALVSSFLALQARASDDPGLRGHLDEAQRRLSAVALVHRRLYRSDQVETVDLSRYLEELCTEMLDSMGGEWSGHVSLDLAPVSVPTDRAVPLGLVLTELVINANKYAYGGEPGPIDIALEQDRAQIRLVVADRGRGRSGDRQGFGTRMMRALVAQLSGALEYRDNGPGLRAVLTAPIAA
ncbi:histidine kinase dimerization/phosphoacceptor domain -containing protein [Enterovirga aerilata]|uniref:GAF domain-containing protein n=1 Tax=Enterovirga aerilata TaxID=2730920 RepID=A0A849HZW9_9HYPH|nr:histidine kinase dimerization/phosphoacceptor domain -containing protein [Enterovirga sp. DB1703]NNM73066.1 GAF domain-containing protein [Enterovirga sp. DB1703]